MTTPPPKLTIAEHFTDLKDPRTGRMVDHYLNDILTIAICAVICGADGWVEIEAYGQEKENWLRERLQLKLPHGIPSHDTFGRVFALLDPEQFEQCFCHWTQAVSQLTAGEVVPIDGKRVRGSHDGGKAAIHMVSAWACTNRLVLGQVKTEEKSNEITAIPELLKLLVLKGCIVTIDAMGCQTEITAQIRAQDADYVIALKGNQGTLYDNVRDLFAYAFETNFRNITHDFNETWDTNHGRREIRRYWTISEPEFITYLDPEHKWTGLRSIGMVEAQRYVGEQSSIETRYYISSLAGQAQPFGHAVRCHWEIENKVHWVLDIAFREDECRIRTGHAAENFAVLRHVALNLLRQDNMAKCGIKAKRLKAAWNENYLLKILSGLT
jgi:predicted transposase YbfD/YdcC